MGVYIKGMEMPETCKLCYLSEFDPGFYAYVCKPTGIRIDYDMAKVDRPRTICPLVPAPPHGRLGDMDAIARKIRRLGDYVDFTKDEIAGWFENGDFETIIPAEEGET